MRIGLDIDDTITNSSDVFLSYARKYNRQKHINYSIISDTLDQTKAFGWNDNNKEEFKELYLKKILLETKPKKDVKHVLKRLKNSGINIYLISSRNDNEINDMFNFTKEWLKLNEIVYDELFVNVNDKLPICRKCKLDIFIDDNFQTCNNIFNNSNIKVLMYNTKYNINFSSNIMRVSNWKEILSYISNVESIGV